MPTYDYMCDSCNITFEVQHKMTDDSVIVCPQCGEPAHQVLSAGFGLNFTGKGFYQTDTRSAAASVSGRKNDKKSNSSEKHDAASHNSTGSASNAACSN